MRISASAVGDTDLTGQVKYYANGEIVREFGSSISFTTAPGTMTGIFVRFKGVPYGSAVNGSICYAEL